MKKITAVLVTFLFCSNIQAQTWTPIGFTSTTTDGAIIPTIAFDTSGLLYVAYSNYWDDKASVKKYDGSIWSTVGATGFSAGNISFCGSGAALALAPDGTPYVAYADTGVRKATVMKYNGTNWVVVGIPGISNGGISAIAMAIDNSGTPYVVFTDSDTTAPGTTVMKFNGTSWVLVGVHGFSNGYVNFPSIAIGPDGMPSVAYGDYLHGGNAKVMKYNGSSWVTVGSADFSIGFTLYTSIAIDKNGTPYVAYQDQGLISQGATVMKFDGTNWVNVGSPGFSAGGVIYTNIAIDTNCTPYVSYGDYANGQKATVMKFSGGSWVNVGTPGFSAGVINFNSLALDRSGTPYLAYTDTGSGNSVVMKFEATTKVKTISNASSKMIAISPVPNNGLFLLNVYSPKNENATVIITNMAGETVIEFNRITNTEIQVQLDVKPGLYFVTSIINKDRQSTGFIVY